MAAPEKVIELVERFDRNKKVYCGSGFNETQLRREFLDPFFEALGWDVDNKGGASPLYQDVVHEYPTEVDGSQKTADYAYRVGEKVKFFVEAKKPGTRLKDDAGPALQLRRYAYSAGLPLSILSDFEEFAVYDGRVPPKKADVASRARLMYFTYDQYVEAWEKMAAVFSKDAVWSGAFDTYADENRGGKAEPVDKAFLKMLERWRDDLARNVANRNREKNLNKYELSAAVQAILDRIIFLRAAEDRGIEDRGRLEALQQGEGVYAGLMELCLEADDVYNSGLFHFRAEKGRATSRDELTPTLHIDDAVLRKIMRELYESPYEFGVVPVEILGQVYEQFLGKTIWLDGQGVHIDYKPEVRKAKGVYYTPQYIVEYIVKNTVGELLKGCKTPRDAAKLKILDPACGSGSFLLGAYQHLINWHLEWYVNDGPAKHEGTVVPTPGPGPVSWRLTAAAKKDILVNNLFGVDIDPQAVEVTKLSLLLKALEGESRESVGAQTKFLRERILPDLAGNIKCGNSLIGSDYYEGQLMPDDDERRRVNPFDWEVEFADIMKAGGFDAVIGNPPYVRGESIKNYKGYLKSRFESANSSADLYVYFIENGTHLIREKGLLGLIVSNSFLRTTYAENLRVYLKENTTVLKIVDFGGNSVFEDAKDTYVCVIIIGKYESRRSTKVIKVEPRPRVGNIELDSELNYEIPPSYLKPNVWIIDAPSKRKVFEKILDAGVPLGEYVERKLFYGLKTGFNRAFVINSEIRNGLLKRNPEAVEIIKPFIGGEDIRRYFLNSRGIYLILTKIGTDIERYPAVLDHLKYFEKQLVKRTDKGVYWWELRPCEYYGEFEKPKIVFPDIAKYPRFHLDKDNIYLGNTGYVLGSSEEYLLGILNSKLFWFAISNISIPFGIRAGEYRYRLIYQYMVKIPIRSIDFSDPSDVARHNKMVALVEEMLELHKRLAAAKSDADKKRIQRAVDATDRKIDGLVYELYGLTDEEIRIVEGP